MLPWILKKSQNEMKRKLRKFRDRQREIQRARSSMEKPPESVDEFLSSNKTMTGGSQRRPMTCPPASLRAKMSSFLKPKLDLTLDDETAIDPSFFTDQHKSKIDLRPKTAATMRCSLESLRKANPKGRLGPASAQERYFDEDEIADRAAFYLRLTNLRKKTEQDTFDCEIETKVGEFMGQSEDQIKRRREYSRFLRQTDDPVRSMIPKKIKPSATKISYPGQHSGIRRIGSNLKENYKPGEKQPLNSQAHWAAASNKMRAYSAIQRGTARGTAELSRTDSSYRIRPMTSVISRA